MALANSTHNNVSDMQGSFASPQLTKTNDHKVKTHSFIYSQNPLILIQRLILLILMKISSYITVAWHIKRSCYSLHLAAVT